MNRLKQKRNPKNPHPNKCIEIKDKPKMTDRR